VILTLFCSVLKALKSEKVGLASKFLTWKRVKHSLERMYSVKPKSLSGRSPNFKFGVEKVEKTGNVSFMVYDLTIPIFEVFECNHVLIWC